PGLLVWARATPALNARRSPAIASFMKELLCCFLGANLRTSKTFLFCALLQTWSRSAPSWKFTSTPSVPRAEIDLVVVSYSCPADGSPNGNSKMVPTSSSTMIFEVSEGGDAGASRNASRWRTLLLVNCPHRPSDHPRGRPNGLFVIT